MSCEHEPLANRPAPEENESRKTIAKRKAALGGLPFHFCVQYSVIVRWACDGPVASFWREPQPSRVFLFP